MLADLVLSYKAADDVNEERSTPAWNRLKFEPLRVTATWVQVLTGTAIPVLNSVFAPAIQLDPLDDKLQVNTPL